MTGVEQPDGSARFLQMKLNASLEHEVCGMILVYTQHRLIDYLEPFRGTLDQASVYPREVVSWPMRSPKSSGDGVELSRTMRRIVSANLVCGLLGTRLQLCGADDMISAAVTFSGLGQTVHA